MVSLAEVLARHQRTMPAAGAGTRLADVRTGRLARLGVGRRIASPVLLRRGTVQRPLARTGLLYHRGSRIGVTGQRCPAGRADLCCL